MKVELTLNGDEIAKAVKEYVTRQGWDVSSVSIEIKRGYDGDPREPGSPDTAKAVLQVTPKSSPVYDHGPLGNH